MLPSVYIIFKLYLIYSTQLVFFPCKRKLTCHATPQQPLICKEQETSLIIPSCVAFCLLSPYHPRTWDFLGKWGFWTDSSDSCTLKGLVGASQLESLHWAVIWCPGTNKNLWSLTTSLLSPHNPISEPVLSRRKWKHSGLKFPRWLYWYITFLVSPASWDFLGLAVIVHQGMTQQLNIMAVGWQIYCSTDFSESCRQAWVLYIIVNGLLSF